MTSMDITTSMTLHHLLPELMSLPKSDHIIPLFQILQWFYFLLSKVSFFNDYK